MIARDNSQVQARKRLVDENRDRDLGCGDVELESHPLRFLDLLCRRFEFFAKFNTLCDGVRRHTFLFVIGASLFVSSVARSNAADEANRPPTAGPLMTRWAADVSADHVLSEYPRPQLERPDWKSLNGLWDYAIRPKAESEPAAYDGKILVPFAIESALSGVTKQVGSANRLWYRRTFEWPELWHNKRAILHFGAVDWQSTVLVNGKEVGTHQGGYTPFSIDVTDALKPSGVQNLVVAVWDPTDGGSQPRGKQSAKPDGIWYTSVTGIWQTVWLEPVAPTSIVSLKVAPDIDAGTVQIAPLIRGSAENVTIEAVVFDGKSQVATATAPANGLLSLSIPNAKLWTPDSPNLYRLKVSLLQNEKVVDTASSYFGMRKISLIKDQKGIPRLSLNNRPLFQFGPLDQGWWPDGLYTAPTDSCAEIRHRND